MKRVLLLFLLAVPALAQNPATLREEIAAMDKKLFDAFNARDIKVVGTVFDKSLEFYHDKGGLSGYDQTVKQLGENFSRGNSPRRELLPESLEVYPIPNYGAMQIGAHRFCSGAEGKDCGVFKFVHVWKKTDGEWRITRVVSYDN
ncbi:MAG TPA: nuclear transport factor 2 family protein [Thermoanaerobaculia bacterium]|nr:nuclear transport factor 2 family protein [Thermoanaerobaculia bacterium]